MPFALIIPSFIAGVLTFLAPCTFPLVPVYLSIITGGVSEKVGKRRLVLNGLFFVLGFTLVFTAFGTLVGFFGSALVPYRIWLSRIGGIFVILFGIFLLGSGRFNLDFLMKDRHLKPPAIFKPGSKLNSLVVGLAFGFGWTPCVGPILGSILLLASTSSTVFQGTLLLLVFSLGMAVPFMLIALGVGSIEKRLTPYLGIISKVSGVFLVLLGILLLTNSFSLLISYGYELLGFLGYEKLLNFL
jgi:cytochrome c-type biogenesis protein